MVSCGFFCGVCGGVFCCVLPPPSCCVFVVVVALSEIFLSVVSFLLA